MFHQSRQRSIRHTGNVPALQPVVSCYEVVLQQAEYLRGARAAAAVPTGPRGRDKTGLREIFPPSPNPGAACLTRQSPARRGAGFHAAERFINALLQHAQQPGLHGRRDVADFVQKDGPALGQRKAAGFVLARVGERAKLCSPNNSLSSNESGSAPQLRAMNFFACHHESWWMARANSSLPVSAGAFHRAAYFRSQLHRRQQIEQLPHRRAASDDIRKRILLLGLRGAVRSPIVDHGSSPRRRWFCRAHP